ncbi:thiamine phosphate synthase [Nocardioides acrostichi]|uniref:Thiamine-phosphate synthase n=1 Tax=Nocardioides acrostichi TaxID=2784339 RepID=A0A930YCK2_9ACTN|nr:thiamine phosphate synthase [Nocardioides acrostichi]MBF4163583.1 thiamine phosphate synthase [Nocardioides acrostichi]
MPLRSTEHTTQHITEHTSDLPRLFCLLGPDDDLRLLPGLVAAGVRGFQVRDKTGTDAAALALVAAVLDAVRPAGGVVVVDDRVDVALAAGADGVHLGADDLPVAAARRIAPDLLVGATCRDAAAVGRAREAGADYAGFGPLFATTTKTGLPAPLGCAALHAATGALPLLGIGGLDGGRAAEARAAGAHGVAVAGAIWRHRDPLASARELLDAVA